MTKELVQKARQGDKEAMTLLYNSVFKSLYKYIKYKVATDEIAEDICSESFIRAFENLNKFKGKSTFKTYVYTIARNLIVDWYKTKKRDIPLNEQILKNRSETKQEDKEMKQLNTSTEVRQILSKLKKREKKVIEMRYLFEFSVKETAEALKISESNVKVITHRAIKNVKKTLSQINNNYSKK